MSPVVFTVALVSGAAMLALWTDVRFPALQPSSVGARLVNAMIAGVAVVLVPIPTTPGAWQMIVLLAGFLPALVYAFLAALWLLRSLQGALLRS